MSYLDKNIKTPLCVQLRNLLLSDIRSGLLPANERIPGERVIAERYGISRGTVVDTLKLLEEQGYVERIAARGTFVSSSAPYRASVKKILFPFPEQAISLDHLSYSNWCIDTEIYHGLIEGAHDYGMQLNLQFFDESQDRSEAYLHLKESSEFDAVFFVSHQLPALMQVLEEKALPYTVVSGRNSLDFPSKIFYNEKDALEMLAKYIASTGVKKIGLLRDIVIDEDNKKKIEQLIANLAENNVSIAEAWTFFLRDNKEDAYEKLKAEFPRHRADMPELFFCESVTHPFAFYRLMSEFDLKVGTDVSVIGYGSRMALEGLTPALTYLRVPYFEMGKKAAKILNNFIENKANKANNLLNAELIEGLSVKNN